MQTATAQTSGNTAEMETSAMVRSWTNTNPATRGIAELQITCSRGKHWINVRGNANGSLSDWGEVEIETIYTENRASTRGMAFVAKYDFGFVETLLEGNVNCGLLVLAAFHTFRDGSNRADYFSREFFNEVAA